MELATIARPYTEACFAAVAHEQRAAFADLLDELAVAATDPLLREFASNPKAHASQVAELLSVAVKTPLSSQAKNLIALLVDNARLDALPELAKQFRAKLDASKGMAKALIESAFPIDDSALGSLLAKLEKKFGCRLRANVVIAPHLIGGVRVRVGDEVLDASVLASLTRMKNSLTA